MAQPFVERAMHVETSVLVPSRMPDAGILEDGEALYVLISQGGKSTNTIKAVEQAGIEKDQIISITENPASPIAKISRLTFKLPWDEAEAVGAKTKGVTCSVTIAMLLFLELALAQNRIDQAFYDQTLAALNRFCLFHAENVARILQWYEANREEMAASECMLVLAQQEFLGAGMESALKLLETIHRPVFAYEFEEYLHGVANTLSSRSYMLFMMPGGDKRERSRRLFDFAVEKGAKCFAINVGDEDATVRAVNLLPSGSRYVDVLTYLLPGQILSAQLSEFCGIDVDKPQFPGFSTMMGTKA
jgi:glucoselysine-6-phosphate deglycase